MIGKRGYEKSVMSKVQYYFLLNRYFSFKPVMYYNITRFELLLLIISTTRRFKINNIEIKKLC